MAVQLQLLAELILGPTSSRSGHSERLMPAVAWVCDSAGMGPADLSGIAVVAGPGGFTGVRSGLAVAKAVAQSRGIPVQGIDTLDALAAGYPGEGLVSPLLDARRGEVFAALYRRHEGTLERLAEPALVHLSDWLAFLRDRHPGRVALIGEGALRHPEPIASHPGSVPVPPEAHLLRPATVARLAAPHLASGGEDPIALVPRYHRAPAMAPDWAPGQGTGIR